MGEESALLSNKEKSTAAGHIIRGTICNRLGHTAGKCAPKARFPPADARAEKRVMNVISCYNCGRSGHIAMECRQTSSNELREHRIRADYGRQETSFDSLEPSSATRNACNVQKRNWISSGNGFAGATSKPSIPRARRH